MSLMIRNGLTLAKTQIAHNTSAVALIADTKAKMDFRR